jgi:hypothetical protein
LLCLPYLLGGKIARDSSSSAGAIVCALSTAAILAIAGYMIWLVVEYYLPGNQPQA